MLKQHLSKENIKLVGDMGLRIGKDIVREGSKVVAGKAIGAVIVSVSQGGFKNVKNITLDSVLGDITRIEKKEERKRRKMKKRLLKGVKKYVEQEELDINDTMAVKDFIEEFNANISDENSDMRITIADIVKMSKEVVIEPSVEKEVTKDTEEVL